MDEEMMGLGMMNGIVKLSKHDVDICMIYDYDNESMGGGIRLGWIGGWLLGGTSAMELRSCRLGYRWSYSSQMRHAGDI